MAKMVRFRSDKLFKACEEKGLTSRDVAEMVGLSKCYITTSANNGKINVLYLKHICDAIGADFSEFVVEREMPPKYEDVKKYCEENGFVVNAYKFFNHYSVNGWKVGKGDTQVEMTDWVPILCGWEKRQRDRMKDEPVTETPVVEVEQSSYPTRAQMAMLISQINLLNKTVDSLYSIIRKEYEEE